MHEALILIARAIALAHDHWRSAIGFMRGEPDSNFASRLLREAIHRHGAPT